MRTNVAIVRDHSGSMSHLTKKAMDDYNLMLDSIRSSSAGNKTFLSVVCCGVGPMGRVETEFVHVDVDNVKHMNSYVARGGSTPLFDSVGEAIDAVRRGDDGARDTAFLVLVITDGEENSSKIWNARTIAAKFAELHKSDKWTFAFRVPKGQRRYLEGLGIPPGNIMEWEQTEQGYTASTEQTTQGISGYFASRSAGQTSNCTFYANPADFTTTNVKYQLVDASYDYLEFMVPAKCDGMMIRDFCEKYGPQRYELGKAFYQLTKPEKQVQDNKIICVRDRLDNKIYTGAAARHLLGLPATGTVKLAPGRMGKYDLFIQSTSVNRKIVGGSSLLYRK